MKNKFLNYCYDNKTPISLVTVIIVCVIIGISTLVFNNSYYNTGWHWSVSLFGCGIMFFANFCITDVDDEAIKINKKTNTDLDL